MDTKNTKLCEYFVKNYNLEVLSYSEEDPQNVISLILKNHGITSIDRHTLSLATNLQFIDLSYNLLNDLSILADIDLPHLKKLDLKYNKISDFSFAQNLKSLEDFDIRGNDFDSSLFYWMVCHLPKLKLLNSEDITEIRKYVTMAELRILSSTDDIFSNKFEISVKNTESGIIQMKKELTNSLFEKCGIIGEAQSALKCKVEHFVDNKLNNVINNIMSKVMTNQCLSNNITIKTRDNQIGLFGHSKATNSMEGKTKFSDIESDILTKAIAEAIGQLNIEIKPSVPETKPNNKCIHEIQKSRESLNLNSNALKRKPSLNEEPSHNSKTNSKNISSFPLRYELIKILRKHSRRTENNDSKTPIWDIKYRPIGKNYFGTHLVVTCGGNIVNLIDLRTGSVSKRYEDSNNMETFNCIVWRDFIVNTTNGMTRDLSLVCVGATKLDKKLTNILFLNADDMTDYFKIRSHSKSVNCLLFHPIKMNILFSGSYDRKIMVWKLDSGKMTKLSKLSSLTVHKLMEIDCNNRILSSVFAKSLDVLVVSGEDGIVLIKPFNNTTDKKDNNYLTLRVDLEDNKKLVDGLVMISKDSNLFAFRFKEFIIVADLSKMLDSAQSKRVVPLVVVCRLRYCSQKCDYFYMTIESRLLCCGSADGQILLYYLKDSILKSNQKENLLEPIRVLPKPELNSFCSNNQLFVNRLNDLLFMNIAAISPNHEYVVSGSNTNLICIWKRTHFDPNQSNKRLKTVQNI